MSDDLSDFSVKGSTSVSINSRDSVFLAAFTDPFVSPAPVLPFLSLFPISTNRVLMRVYNVS